LREPALTVPDSRAIDTKRVDRTKVFPMTVFQTEVDRRRGGPAKASQMEGVPGASARTVADRI
jgi:hypothetical protein